jgi:hypothetical protein
MNIRNMERHSSAAMKTVRAARRLAITLTLVFAVLMLSSCGTQFAYNRLDWLTHHFLSGQVSLDATQSRELRAYLDEFFQWHRQHELPRYAAFLERVADATDEPVNRSQLEVGRLEVEALMHASVSQGAPDAARWLRSLRPEQVEEMFANFAEKGRKSRAKACERDPEERLADNVDRMVENVERWTGRLRDSQRALIAARLAQFPADDCSDHFADDGRHTFRDVVDEYRSRPDFAQRITVFVMRPEARGDAEYRRTFEANRERFLALLVEINQSLSAEQRARSVKRLRSMAAELRELSAAEG